MPINSRQKGARGERLWRDELRANGYQARRGQQFCGSPESPEVVCPDLDWLRFEVKAVERLNIEDAMEQARRDAGCKTPIVAHRRNFRPWLVTMDAETFFQFLRGDFPLNCNGKNGNSGIDKQSPTDFQRLNEAGEVNPPSPKAMEDTAKHTQRESEK